MRTKKVASKKIANITLMLAACTAVSMVSINDARAEHLTRKSCFVRGSAGYMGRQMGIRNASRLFTALWGRLQRSCAQIDRLAQIISETPLAAPTTRGAFQACFYQGYTDTLFDQLDGAYTRCGDRCYNAGAEMGKISAQGYCAASAAVGGLDDPGFIEQPALPFCGQNLVMGCKGEYVQQATVEIDGCSVYTEGAFAQIFDDSVRQDCFVPTDVPIRDLGGVALNEESSLSTDQQLF